MQRVQLSGVSSIGRAWPFVGMKRGSGVEEREEEENSMRRAFYDQGQASGKSGPSTASEVADSRVLVLMNYEDGIC